MNQLFRFFLDLGFGERLINSRRRRIDGTTQTGAGWPTPVYVALKLPDSIRLHYGLLGSVAGAAVFRDPQFLRCGGGDKVNVFFVVTNRD